MRELGAMSEIELTRHFRFQLIRKERKLRRGIERVKAIFEALDAKIAVLKAFQQALTQEEKEGKRDE